MKKIVLISLVFILSVFTAIEVNAQDATATASIDITAVAPLETTLDTDLVIDELVVTSDDQTFIIEEDGTVDVGTPANININTLASFTLAGAADEEVEITVPDTDIELGPDGEFTFSAFQSPNVTLDGDGEGTFSLGFRVDVDANAPAGDFEADGVIEVTAAYSD